MKEETARELYQDLQRSCHLLGKATKIKGSPDDVVRWGVKLAPRMPKRAVNAARKGGALEFLRSFPEPSEEEKAAWKVAIGELPFLLRKALAQGSKELPHKPGGRPSKFKTPEEKLHACEDVARLLPLTERTDALGRVARKYQVSARTMRRAYADYVATVTKNFADAMKTVSRGSSRRSKT